MSYIRYYENDDELYDFEDDESDDESDDEFYRELYGERRSAPRPSFKPPRPAPRVPARAPLPPPNVQPSADGGVSKATLNTPKGSADIQLPARVPTREEFTAAISKLDEAVAANTRRINTMQQDLSKIGDSVTSLTTSVNTLAKETRENHALLQKQHKESVIKQRKALKKLRADQSAQNMNNMMITLLMTSQLQSRFDGHTHQVSEGGGETDKPTGGSSSDSTTLLLPLMLMSQPQGDGGNGGMNNMMMPLLMLTMLK
jgi:hypothetical protein